jgi:hypothetical protein
MNMKRATMALSFALMGVSAAANEFKCNERTGIDRARCERHEKMFAKCGPVEGEAHFVCDREFLIAHPLECKVLTGDDLARCEAEVAAFKVCELRQGREFVRCVRDETKTSPMGRH